jgi:hypothetical protein
MEYTSADINTKFHKLTASEQVAILHEALEIMQSYNGRSKLVCVAMAMGYEYDGCGAFTRKSK